jgi:hypothetical protein
MVNFTARVDLLVKRGVRDAFGLALVILILSGCRPGHGFSGGKKVEGTETEAVGAVRVGKESVEFYIGYGFDSAVLGFSVSTGAGPTRYLPIIASTFRGIPSVVLEVFTSKSEAEMWVRSSWPDDETLAYYRVGADTAITPWGVTKFLKAPMPDGLSGGPVPFPKLIMGKVVKKATFKHELAP